jgi:phosphoenolpyruvate synthase/pyruvate phosphate dikinase
VQEAPLPAGLEAELREAYRALAGERGGEPAVAVRSSATAEDLPEASFAGQHESFLDVRGGDTVVAACRRCWASLFTDRAIVYRMEHGFDHLSVSLSVAIQKMVAADRGVAGVIFTIDPDSGFRDVVVIDAAYGLGEAVVQGQLDPDEFWLFKPALRSGHRAMLRRRMAPVFDERNPAVLAMLGQVIEAARRAGRKVGICGQAPSDYPELVRFLVRRGITSISLNPDALVRGLEAVAAAEAELEALTPRPLPSEVG